MTDDVSFAVGLGLTALLVLIAHAYFQGQGRIRRYTIGVACILAGQTLWLWLAFGNLLLASRLVAFAAVGGIAVLVAYHIDNVRNLTSEVELRRVDKTEAEKLSDIAKGAGGGRDR
jgi:hypothetical protein